MYIVGIRENQGTSAEVLEKCGCVYTSEKPSTENILNNMVDKYGGNPSAYCVYHVDPNSNDAKRIFNEHAFFSLTWGETSSFDPDDTSLPIVTTVISGVDFSEYDSWNQIDVSATKYVISADGLDTSVVTFTMFHPNGVDIDTSFTSAVDFDISELLPNEIEPHLIQINFTSGVGNIDFKWDRDSIWQLTKGRKDIEKKLKIKVNRKITVTNI